MFEIIGIILLILPIYFIFYQIRSIVRIKRTYKEFIRISDDCERWWDEILYPHLRIKMMQEHSNFISTYTSYSDDPVEQLKCINNYRQNLINKYKYIIPSMKYEHRSKRLSQILK